ncbi:MAG: ATP-binding protein [Clostridia bacterium]|nr:ATP-binding protein [Clostridia bacterium]
MDQMTISATVDQIRGVTLFVNERLDAQGCSQRIKVQVDVAIDEILSNIAHYAYNPETGPATVRVEVEEDPLCVVIAFIDHGIPFDPLAEERPDLTHLPKAERPIGGLGLFMVKKTMDDVSYTYKDGQNILTIRKKI